MTINTVDRLLWCRFEQGVLMHNFKQQIRKFTYCTYGLVLIGTSLNVGAATAATYYVAKTGSNSHNCSQAQSPSTPKLTINSALSCFTLRQPGVGAGHTVIVRPGTYNEQLQDVIPGGSSWSSPFTLKAEARRTVTLVPNVNTYGIRIQGADSSYAIVEGFVVDGTAMAQGVVGIGRSGTSSYATHIGIIDCELMNSPGNGIIATGDGHHFIGNDIHHNGATRFEHGIYYAGYADWLIEGNSIHDNEGHGVHVYGTPGSDDGIVRNNFVFSNGSRGILVGYGSRGLVYNNVVYKNGFKHNEAGIAVHFGSPKDMKVYNNTVYGNKNYGITIWSGSNTIVKNNIAYNNGKAQIHDVATNTTESNNIETNPSFVDVDKADFHLQSDSNAIDTGTDLSPVLSMDIDGNSRPQGSSFDIGAYEFNFSEPPEPVADNESPNPPTNLRINWGNE